MPRCTSDSPLTSSHERGGYVLALTTSDGSHWFADEAKYSRHALQACCSHRGKPLAGNVCVSQARETPVVGVTRCHTALFTAEVRPGRRR